MNLSRRTQGKFKIRIDKNGKAVYIKLKLVGPFYHNKKWEETDDKTKGALRTRRFGVCDS